MITIKQKRQREINKFPLIYRLIAYLCLLFSREAHFHFTYKIGDNRFNGELLQFYFLYLDTTKSIIKIKSIILDNLKDDYPGIKEEHICNLIISRLK